MSKLVNVEVKEVQSIVGVFGRETTVFPGAEDWAEAAQLVAKYGLIAAPNEAISVVWSTKDAAGRKVEAYCAGFAAWAVPAQADFSAHPEFNQWLNRLVQKALASKQLSSIRNGMAAKSGQGVNWCQTAADFIEERSSGFAKGLDQGPLRAAYVAQNAAGISLQSMLKGLSVAKFVECCKSAAHTSAYIKVANANEQIELWLKAKLPNDAFAQFCLANRREQVAVEEGFDVNALLA